MSPVQQAPHSPAGDADAHLERAVAAAALGNHESGPLCEAVDEIVTEAKDAGEPPERVLVRVKSVAYRVLDQLRLPLGAARRIIAWIVRCAISAYYGRSRPESPGQ